jgi:hypothetical protein
MASSKSPTSPTIFLTQPPHHLLNVVGPKELLEVNQNSLPIFSFETVVKRKISGTCDGRRWQLFLSDDDIPAEKLI